MEQSQQNSLREQKAENKSSLIKLCVIVFIVFLIAGLGIGYAVGKLSANNAQNSVTPDQYTVTQLPSNSVTPTISGSNQTFSLTDYDFTLSAPMGWKMSQVQESLNCGLVRQGDGPTYLYKQDCADKSQEINFPQYTLTSPDGKADVKFYIGIENNCDNSKTIQAQIKGQKYDLDSCSEASDNSKMYLNDFPIAGSKSNWSYVSVELDSQDGSQINAMLNILSSIK